MISIEGLSKKLNRKTGLVMQMMKKRGYLDADGKPERWCIEGKIMSKEGKITRRGELLLVDEIGMGKISDTDLKKFFDKPGLWLCIGLPLSYKPFEYGKYYSAEDIISWYHANPDAEMKIDISDEEPMFSLDGYDFSNDPNPVFTLSVPEVYD